MIDAQRIGEVTMSLLDRLKEDYGEDAELAGVLVVVEIEADEEHVTEWQGEGTVAQQIGMAQIVATPGARD